MWETTASQRCDRRMPTLLNCSRLATKSVLHHHLGQAELHWELALLTCCNCWKTNVCFQKSQDAAGNSCSMFQRKTALHPLHPQLTT